MNDFEEVEKAIKQCPLKAVGIQRDPVLSIFFYLKSPLTDYNV